MHQDFSAEEAELALRDAGAAPGGAVPGDGPPAHGLSPATGRTPYLLGLLAWLPIPFFSVLIAGIAMAAAYPRQRKLSAHAAENARRAANWGLTYALGMTLSIATALITFAATASSNPDAAPWQMLSILPIFGWGAMHLVIIIVGLTCTSRGEVFTPPAVPFFHTATVDPQIERILEARRARETGTSVYVWGSLALAPVPVVSTVVAGLAMAAAARWRRRTSPVAVQNAREAANWGLTLAALSVALYAALWVAEAAFGGTVDSNGGVLAMLVLAVVAPWLAHLVVVLLGIRKAARGEVCRNRLAFQFLRAGQTGAE